MILGLTTLSDANIARVLADPPLIWCLLAPEDPGAYEEARAARSRPSFFQKLFGKRFGGSATVEPAEPLSLGAGEGLETDLDKAWHGIHYLLTGTVWHGDAPLNFLLAGGVEVGDIDVGYGPARVLSAAETRAAHDALAGIGDDALRQRFDPSAMAKHDIYPAIWNRPPEEDDALGYLMDYVATLRQFLETAVAQKHGLVVSVT